VRKDATLLGCATNAETDRVTAKEGKMRRICAASALQTAATSVMWAAMARRVAA
jgi:hypothetical protein